FFKETCVTNAATGYLYTRVDKQQHSVSWIYDHVDGYKWSVVYNYKEGKWSDRDPQGVVASLYMPFAPRGMIAINDVTSVINDPPNDTNLINGDWQFPTSTINELHGGDSGSIFNSNVAFEKSSGDPIQCSAETYEF